MICHVNAILWKQIKDTLKNKEVLIQFVMFPVMTLIMENAISIQGMPEHFFANLFAIMYVGMAPLTSAAAIIAEEKEKKTLRVLQMYNVKATEYLISNAIYIVSLCMLGSLVIGLAGGYRGQELGVFMLCMLTGHAISCVLGSTVGVFSKNQMSATGLTVPLMMILSFMPMLSMFNETIGKVAKFTFSQQLYLILNSINDIRFETENILILICNIAVVIIAFLVIYKKTFRK